MSDAESKLAATPSNRMTPEEIAAFARSGRRNAILGTVGADGLPHVTPVWYLFEDGVWHVELGAGRRHLANLRRDARATLLVEEDLRLTHGWAAGARGVMVAGPVEISADPAVHGPVSERMAVHYLGDEKDDPEFLATVGEETFFLVTLRPERVVSWDYSKAG